MKFSELIPGETYYVVKTGTETPEFRKVKCVKCSEKQVKAETVGAYPFTYTYRSDAMFFKTYGEARDIWIKLRLSEDLRLLEGRIDILKSKIKVLQESEDLPERFY